MSLDDGSHFLLHSNNVVRPSVVTVSSVIGLNTVDHIIEARTGMQ